MSRDSQLDLSWNAVDNVNFYTVKKAASPSGPFEVVAANITEPAYRVGGVPNGVTEYYAVSATNVAGESEDSASVSGVALAQIGTPSLTAEAGDAQVTLSWTPAAQANRYTLKRATSIEGPYTILAADVTGTNYYRHEVWLTVSLTTTKYLPQTSRVPAWNPLLQRLAPY